MGLALFGHFIFLLLQLDKILYIWTDNRDPIIDGDETQHKLKSKIQNLLKKYINFLKK